MMTMMMIVARGEKIFRKGEKRKLSSDEGVT